MNYNLHDERSEIMRFCEGDSVRAYDYFGAHFEERDGKPGVMFRVWAPNAENVAVKGEAAADNPSGIMMKKREGGVWEQFVEGAAEGQSYTFGIVTPAFRIISSHLLNCSMSQHSCVMI